MDSTYTRPKLRSPLDIQWRTIGQDHVLSLQCPVGITEQPLFLVPAVAPVLQLFQGTLTADEIVAHFAKDGLTKEILNELIKVLDENLFLANARFFAAEQEVREAFHAAPVRAPYLAGLSYPEQPEKLRSLINGLMVAPTPGVDEATAGELCCLVAPHIDYRRGGKCYGATYPELARSKADLYILMGTAHKYSRLTFHLTAKDFACPTATFPCDTSFVTRVANRHGIKRSFADEFLHKREHSLELQLPFMAAVKPGASIVPILVGSFYHMVSASKYPHEFEEYESFVCSLLEAIRTATAEGRKVCFIAGVDMAHVGRNFGDTESLSTERMQQIAARDCQYLAAIERHDKKALFEHICEDSDARRICGFPTMYTILDIFERLGVQYACSPTRYDQAVDYNTDCAVTFAGMGMYSRV